MLEQNNHGTAADGGARCLTARETMLQIAREGGRNDPHGNGSELGTHVSLNIHTGGYT